MIDINCPKCGSSITKFDGNDAEIKSVGIYDINTHSNKYFVDISKYKGWFEGKCKTKGCKTLVRYRKPISKDEIIEYLEHYLSNDKTG
jgi:hypothetical protein